MIFIEMIFRFTVMIIIRVNMQLVTILYLSQLMARTLQTAATRKSTPLLVRAMQMEIICVLAK